MNESPAATPREVLASRGVAVLGGATAVAHVPLAVAHAAVSLPLAGALLAMALVCLPCAGHLWRSPSPRTWATLAATGTVMLLAHAGLALAAGPATTPGSPLVATGHTAHATALGTAGWLHSPTAFAVLSALTALQVAGCLALLRGSARTPSRGPVPDRRNALQV